MKYRTRIQYTETDKALMWDRWRQGESLHAIARLFDRHHSAVGGILSRTGGIRPPQRHRSSLVLALAEREEISRGVMAGRSVRTIARSLGRAPSTVSREIRRNGRSIARVNGRTVSVGLLAELGELLYRDVPAAEKQAAS